MAVNLSAAATMAGAPVVFSVGSDGTVLADMDRATNKASSPYAFSGVQKLLGIKATSIAAFGDEGGGVAVVAMTGAQSTLSINRYAPTVNASAPFAWTGWKPLGGSFVASSVTAAGGINGGGAGVFATDANGGVYESIDFKNPSNFNRFEFSAFQALPGLSTKAISAVSNGASGFVVFALTGAQSYVNRIATSYNGATSGPLLTTSSWQAMPDFIASAIDAWTPPNQGPSVFAIGAGDGALYDSATTTADVPPGAGRYTPFQYVGAISGAKISSIASTTNANSVTVYAMTGPQSFAYEDHYIFNGTSPTPVFAAPFQQVGGFVAGAIEAATAPGGAPIVFATGSSDGSPYINQGLAPPVGATATPYAGWVNLTNPANHPLTVTSGVNNLPVVFTLAPDGSVYVAMDTASAPGTTATDPYSTFKKLDGLTASSLVATSERNGVAVFALTDASSHIYVNQYHATGNATTPYAWTGWYQVGDFVTSSIAAATNSQSTINGPAVFAVGAFGGAFVSQSTPNSVGTLPYNFGAFQYISGLNAKSISAKGIGDSIQLYATTGSQSFAYGNRYVQTGTAQAPAYSWTGWQQLGNFVVTSVTAVNGPSDAANVVASVASGARFINSYVGGTWSGFQPIGLNTGAAFASIAYPNGQGGINVGLTGPYSYVYSTTRSPDGTYSPVQPLGNFVGQSLATSADYFQPAVFITGGDGQIYVNQAVATPGQSSPYRWLGWYYIGAIPG